MQPRNKTLSREELLQSWLQQKSAKDPAFAKENSGSAVPSSAVKKILHSSSANAVGVGLSEISASSINTTNSTGKRTRDSTEAPHHSAASSSSSSGYSGGSASSSRRRSTLITSVPSSVPSFARPLKSSAVYTPAPAPAAGVDTAAKSGAAAKDAAVPSSAPSLRSEQITATAPSDPSSLPSQSSVGSADSQRCEASATAPGAAASPSLLLVAAAQKLLQEQLRADSLLKAKLDADSEIESLRACVQDKEQRLQHLGQALAAAGVTSPLHSLQQSNVAPLPAATSTSLPTKQYMPEVEQRLWEEQQRSLR